MDRVHFDDFLWNSSDRIRKSQHHALLNRPFSDFNNIYPENIILTEKDQVKSKLGQYLYKPRKYAISYQKMGQFKQRCDSESSAQFAMENGGFLFTEQNITVEMLPPVIDKQRLMKKRAALESALEQERHRKQASRPVKFVSFHPVDDAVL